MITILLYQNYVFQNVKAYSIYPILSIDDFVMPDFNVKITVKKEKEKIDDNIKKIFEGSFHVLDNKVNTSKKTEIISETKRSASIKNMSPEKLEEYLGKQYHQLKKLTEKVDLKSLNRVYEKKFLYDLENIIKPSFTTELQKEFSIYGLVNFSGEIDEDKKLKVISPKNSLKFELEKDIYKTQLKLEIKFIIKKHLILSIIIFIILVYFQLKK